MGEQASVMGAEFERREAEVDHALQCIEALDSIYADMQAQREAAAQLGEEVVTNVDAFADSDVSPKELLEIVQGELDGSLQALNPRYTYVMDRLPADVPRPVLNEALARYKAASDSEEAEEDPEREVRLRRITNLMATAGHMPERAREDVLLFEDILRPQPADEAERQVGRVAVRIVRSSPGPYPGTRWVSMTDPRAAQIVGSVGPEHIVAEYPVVVAGETEEVVAVAEGNIRASVDSGIVKEFDTTDRDVYRLVTGTDGSQSLQVFIPGDRASIESIAGAAIQTGIDRRRHGADDAGNVAVSAAAGPLRNVAEGFEHREGVNPATIPVAKHD
jgi:hypothetical protein